MTDGKFPNLSHEKTFRFSPVFPLIRYTLDELEKDINRQQSYVKGDAGAQIYRYFLMRQRQELKEIAKDRDGELA
jgi:hypothetical protein